MDRRIPPLRVLRRGEWDLSGVTLLVLGLVLGGCNVFGGIAPAPNTVDSLVADAEGALAIGETTRAVRLFERAFAKDSTDVRVRVGLANALYADRGLDVFAVRRAAGYLIGDSSGSAAATVRELASLNGPSGKSTTCTDGLHPDPASEQYAAVSLDAPPIQWLTERKSVLERVGRLVVSGVLQQRPGVLTSADPAVRRKGLLVGAVTVVARRAIDVQSVFRATGGTLFLDRSSASDRALVSCAPTEETLDQTHRTLCRLGAAAQQGRQWLQDRTDSAEGDPGLVLSERLQTLSDIVGARIDCS